MHIFTKVSKLLEIVILILDNLKYINNNYYISNHPGINFEPYTKTFPGFNVHLSVCKPSTKLNKSTVYVSIKQNGG